MVEFKFHVRVPMDTWRQWIRHRTASVNEYSTRYSIAIDSRATTTPQEWRLQSTNNKQGSKGLLHESEEEFYLEHHAVDDIHSGGELARTLSALELRAHDAADDVYNAAVEAGVAREVARKNLPLSTYTEAYWKIDLHNLLHYLSLRLHPHAQQEIREFATAIANVVQDVVPLCYEAFVDYRLEAVTFSKQEMKALQHFLQGESGIQDCLLEGRTDILDHRGMQAEGWTCMSSTEEESIYARPKTIHDLDKQELPELLGRYISSKRERAEFLRKLGVI